MLIGLQGCLMPEIGEAQVEYMQAWGREGRNSETNTFDFLFCISFRALRVFLASFASGCYGFSDPE